MARKKKGAECSNQGVVARKGGTGHRWRRTLMSANALALVSSCGAVWAGTTERVSVDSAGVQANNHSINASISGDGRFVVFESYASNFVPDGNGNSDVFVHDRSTGQIERVSVDSAGTQANGFSQQANISADGQFVVFLSSASNLVPGDTNSVGDVFVHDRGTGLTERVSVDSTGAQANGSSALPTISGNGRYVAFNSGASNLVTGDTNNRHDVFVHDRSTGLVERISVNNVGAQGNHHSIRGRISADGRFVVFQSQASNLVPSDTNGMEDVFVHDRSTGLTERISVDSGGIQGNNNSFNPSISADGRFVAFESDASNLVPGDTNGTSDAFVRDRTTSLTERISVDSGGIQGNNNSFNPSISADGRFVAFESDASNLVPGDTNNWADVFVHERETGLTERVSVDSDDVQANSNSRHASISSDGRYVAYHSAASNLVQGDTNGWADVFVHDRGPLVPFISCVGFYAPMATYPVKAKKNRVFPLKMELFDDLGFELMSSDLSAPPLVEVIFTAVGGEPIDVSDEALPAGAGSEGNQFTFADDDIWQFNLKSTNYSAEGSYVVTSVSGDASAYLIDPSCVTSFVIE